MIGFDSINNSNWNEELVAKNKQLLSQALVVAINIYNKSLDNTEESGSDQVVVARQVLSPDDFEVAWGYHIDTKSEVVNGRDAYGYAVSVKESLTTYTNLVIGFSTRLKALIIARTDSEIVGLGDIMVFMQGDYSKATHNWFTDQYTVFDKNKGGIDAVTAMISPKRRFTFFVPGQTDLSITDDRGRDILVYIKQNEVALKFKEFFKTFAAAK